MDSRNHTQLLSCTYLCTVLHSFCPIVVNTAYQNVCLHILRAYPSIFTMDPLVSFTSYTTSASAFCFWYF